MATAFLNYVPEKLIRPQHNGTTGRPFMSVSISCPDSKNGFGSIAVSEKQVYASTLRNGTVKPGFKNVLLGDEDKPRKVSICTGKGKFKDVEYTNAQIKAMVDAERQAFRASQKAAASDFEKVK